MRLPRPDSLRYEALLAYVRSPVPLSPAELAYVLRWPTARAADCHQALVVAGCIERDPEDAYRHRATDEAVRAVRAERSRLRRLRELREAA